MPRLSLALRRHPPRVRECVELRSTERRLRLQDDENAAGVFARKKLRLNHHTRLTNAFWHRSAYAKGKFFGLENSLLISVYNVPLPRELYANRSGNATKTTYFIAQDFLTYPTIKNGGS